MLKSAFAAPAGAVQVSLCVPSLQTASPYLLNLLLLTVSLAGFPCTFAFAQETAAASPAQAPGPAAAETQAEPLPPIVVEQPKTAATRKTTRKSRAAAEKKAAKATTAAAEGEAGNGSGGATAGTAAATGKDESATIFDLGEVNLISGTVIDNRQMRTFSKTTVDQAVALAPGVSSSITGGPRNEKLIFVRGFDRWQVPLSIDGVRVYLPADNRLDFGRFLTADVSEIQIAKGYVSVLDGPGGMGGAVNLVSKKPAKEVEAEVRGGATFGRNGAYEGYETYALAGTRQQGYWAQVSGSLLDSNGWQLSNSFDPTPSENGGLRDNSQTKDWRVNVKAGVTPNATDEYSISYIKQSGEKGTPFHVSDPVSLQRYWDWPYWDVESTYFLSHTQIDPATFVRTKVYYNTFNNSLFSYDQPEMLTQTKPYAFQSWYDDYAYGASTETGHDFGSLDTFKVALHYRRDSHTESQTYNVKGKSCGRQTAPCFSEPDQTSVEDTYSVAAENTVHVTRRLDVVAGVSRDWRNLIRAEDFESGKGLLAYPLVDGAAWNTQGAVIYRYGDHSKIYADVSSRTRFPNLFERFSSRFGGATSNPGLQPERATNYEIGWSTMFAPGSHIATAVFYSDVKNAIQSVPIVYQGQAVNQSQNVGQGHYYGAELSADWTITPALLVGGNVTWIQRDITNPSNPEFELTGVPDWKGIVFVTWRATPALSFTPNLEFAGNRWTVTTDGKDYYRLGAYALANIQAEYAFDAHSSLSFSVRNLFDVDYSLADGFPEAGRTFFANVRSKF